MIRRRAADAAEAVPGAQAVRAAILPTRVQKNKGNTRGAESLPFLKKQRLAPTNYDNQKGGIFMSAEAKKGFIISELKKNGCRITSQRKLLIDVILQDECSCCKEIYYKAAKRDPSIGMATVYRMVKTLEEAGLIQRKNMYRIDYGMGSENMAFA